MSKAIKPSAAETIDRQLAAEALAKQKRGQKPTNQELSALRRVEKAREEDLRWQYYETVPQKHYAAMSGRQAKILYDQAERYGLPLNAKIISLPRVIRAFHDFLAANARILNAKGLAGDPMLGDGADSPNLERYRKVRADQEELKLEEMKGRYVNRETFMQLYQRGQARIRAGMEDLRRAFGQDAARIVEEAWRDAAEIIAADDGGTSDDGNGTASSDA